MKVPEEHEELAAIGEIKHTHVAAIEGNELNVSMMYNGAPRWDKALVAEINRKGSLEIVAFELGLKGCIEFKPIEMECEQCKWKISQQRGSLIRCLRCLAQGRMVEVVTGRLTTDFLL